MKQIIDLNHYHFNVQCQLAIASHLGFSQTIAFREITAITINGIGQNEFPIGNFRCSIRIRFCVDKYFSINIGVK